MSYLLGARLALDTITIQSINHHPGFLVYQGGIQVLRQSFSLGKSVEVFDAGATGSLEGLKAALELPTTKFATDLWIFLDNLEVASHLLSPFPGTSQSVFDKFIRLSSKW